MGSISAMHSLDRVIEKHGEELKAEIMESVPEIVKPMVAKVELENRDYNLEVTLVFTDGSTLDVRGYQIEEFIDRFPDCEVGF